MMLVDDTLHVFGFNYTKLDIEKSRSFGIVTDDSQLVKEACALFEADCTRQPYTPAHDRARRQPRVVARRSSTAFIKKAQEAAAHLRRQGERPPDAPAARGARQSGRRDPHVRQARQGRRRASTRASCPTCGCTSARSSATASAAFIGSQSLRKLELDGRREVGVIVRDARVAKKMREVFEADWAQTPEAIEEAEARREGRKEKESEKEKEKAISGA